MGGSNGMLDAGNVIISAPYYISGKTGTLSGATACVASLANFGRVDPGKDLTQPLIPVPLRVSQVRMKYAVVTTPAVTGVAFELHKTVVTAQATGGGGLLAPIARKTTGYPSISTTEVSINMGLTGNLTITGVTRVQAGSPLDMLTAGAGTDLVGSESIWQPSDLCPLTLEAGEGLAVFATELSGTGILFFAVDFLRQ